MDQQIPEDVKLERLHRLQAVLARQQATFSAQWVGRTFEVLFEKPGRHAGQIVGRSPYLQPVQVTAGKEFIGKVAPVLITEAGPNSLFGALARQI
jgi:tRNA-2-methylthio-N6-dimethylallyladenosine synthase